MTRQNLYTTANGSAIARPNQLTQFYLFLLSHPGMVLDAQKRQEVFTPRRQMPTAMSTAFTALYTAGALDMVRPFVVNKGLDDVPETADRTFLTLDELQVAAVAPTVKAAAAAFPDIRNRIHINITPLQRATGEFSDYPTFQSYCVRDFLSRSYYVSPQNSWLNHGLVQFICKVYNMTMGTYLAMLFNLDPARRGEAVAVFSLFFMAKMTTDTLAPQILKANFKDLRLPQPLDLSQIFDLINDTLGHQVPQSIDECIAAIHALNPDMKSLNRTILYSRAWSMASESYISMIALEYPPLFAHFIMRVLSGDRIGLSIIMKNNDLIKPGQQFAERLAHDARTFPVYA